MSEKRIDVLYTAILVEYVIDASPRAASASRMRQYMKKKTHAKGALLPLIIWRQQRYTLRTSAGA